MMLTGTAPSIDSLSFSNPYVSSGSVSGDFAGMLSDSTPGAYYTIEIDTNGDQMPDASGMTGSPGSFNTYGSMPLSTTSVQARAVEMDSATWQYVYGDWQTFNVNTGVVVNTLPTISSLTFANPMAAYGSVNGEFAGSLTDATPSNYYTIEIDTNGDLMSDITIGAYGGSFSSSSWISLGTTSVHARAIEYDSATGQSAASNWQQFAVSDGVVANTLPTMTAIEFTSPSASDGMASGYFEGSFTDATPTSSYTIEIDTNGDQMADASGMTGGPGAFSVFAWISVGTTGIQARLMEYVNATGQSAAGSWQTFTVSDSSGTGSSSGSGSSESSSSSSGSGTGDSSSSGPGSNNSSNTGSTTGTTTSGTTSGTTGNTTAWTMANGTILNTTAADSAFRAAVLGALGAYNSLMQAAKDGRTADDLLAWTTFTGLMDAADATWTSTNATSLTDHTNSVNDADEQLAEDDANDWDTYWDQIEFLQSIYDDDVDLAKQALNTAYAGADATRRDDDQDSADTYNGVLDGADTVYYGTRFTEMALQWLARAGADFTYAGAEIAATNAMNADYEAFYAAPTASGTWISLDVDSDLQYNSDKAAAEGLHAGIVNSAWTAYDTAHEAALDTYDYWESLAYADYTDALASNDTDYNDLVSIALVAYWLEEDTHADAAADAIADAEFWRDLDLDFANTTYDDSVADAAATRATEHATHLTTYSTAEETKWNILQAELATSALTHTSDVDFANAAGTAALDAAWAAYDLVAENSLSTPAELDAALAARLTAVAAALAGYNNTMAAADAGQTNDDTDSWAAYDTAVNGFLTTYWNDEAQSDSDETHLVNAAYVIWANDTKAAWATYSNDVADAEAQQTLADALSANTAWYDINYATANWYMDNADAGNAYSDAVVPLVADYYSTMEAAWVVLSVASTNASATKTITIANAYAAAVGRWADQMAGTYPGIYAGYMSDMEFANAARRMTQELANADYQNAMSAAGAVWLETALPAWVTYEGEISDHMVEWVDTSSLAWETCENVIADAGLAYTTAAVPVGTQLTDALNANYSEWVHDVAQADKTYWNELADHDVTWEGAATAAEEGWVNYTTVNWTTYVHSATGSGVLVNAAVGEAIVNWAGSVAGQLTGTPYTSPASQVAWPISSNGSPSGGSGGTGGSIVAYQEETGLPPIGQPLTPGNIGTSWSPNLTQEEALPIAQGAVLIGAIIVAAQPSPSVRGPSGGVKHAKHGRGSQNSGAGQARQRAAQQTLKKANTKEADALQQATRSVEALEKTKSAANFKLILGKRTREELIRELQIQILGR